MPSQEDLPASEMSTFLHILYSEYVHLILVYWNFLRFSTDPLGSEMLCLMPTESTSCVFTKPQSPQEENSAGVKKLIDLN